MENKEKLINTEAQHHSLGTIGVLWEAVKTTIRSGKVLFSSLLIASLSFSLLIWGVNHVSEGVIKHCASLLAQVNFHDVCSVDRSVITGLLKDLACLLVLHSTILIFSSVILLFFLVATIFSSSEAYTKEVLNVKDIFLNIRGRWEGPIVVNVYMTIISSMVIGVLLTLIAVMTEGLFGFILTITFIIVAGFYLHSVLAIWVLSIVASVVENESGGLKAIARAKELMKGKRVQAYAIMLILPVASPAAFLISYAMTSNLDGVALTMATMGPQCMVSLFVFVVYTVFYHECKKSNEEAGLEGLKGVYVPVASTET